MRVLNETIADLRTQLAALNTTHTSHSASSNAEIASLRRQSQTLQSSLSRAERERDESRHHIEGLTQELSHTEGRVESLEKDVQTLEQANEAYALQIRQSDRVGSNASEEVEALQKVRSNLSLVTGLCAAPSWTTD